MLPFYQNCNHVSSFTMQIKLSEKFLSYVALIVDQTSFWYYLRFQMYSSAYDGITDSDVSRLKKDTEI